MGEKVRVAVIGGGRTGGPLLENLLELPYVVVVGVADKDSECRGAELAKQHGFLFTNDAAVFAARNNEIDVIIEVSGDPSVKPALKDAFQTNDNRHTIILHDLVARLVLSLAMGSNELIPTYHPDDEGIG
ncbi:MAG: hypothetical protein OEV43_07305 [Coriobacteriia bacterium]|nr:hypothetical protein [Coriobacteriia bacterium]